MAYDIGPKIGIDGEAEFRKQINSVNQTIKTLGSEMKAVTSEFDGQEKSLEQLVAENKVLNQTVNEQEKKLDLLKQGLAASAEKYGENDEKTLRWRQSVAEATAALNDSKKKLNENEKALDSLGEETDEAEDGMEELAEETDEAGKSMEDGAEKGLTFGDILKANLASEAIISGVKALASAISTVANGLADMVKNAAYAADDLNTLSKQTGISTADLQRFQFASEQIDVSVDTLAGSMSKLTKNMSTASKGSGDVYEAFKALGVEVTDQNGNLRDRNEVFQEAIAALGEVENETERDAVAMKIFGKSAQDLNPLILGGAEALQELGDQAETAGLILSQDSLDKLNLVSDSIDTFKATTEGAGRLFSVGFAKPISGAIDTVTGYIQRLTGAFSEGGFEALIEEFGNVFSEALGKISEALPQVVSKAASFVSVIAKAILDNAPLLVQTGLDLILQLSQSMLSPEAISSMVNVAVELITGLVNWLAEYSGVLIQGAVQLIVTLAEALTNPENLVNIVNAAMVLLQSLADGIISALPTLIEAIPTIIDNIVTALMECLPLIIDTGLQLFTAIIGALPEIITTICAAIPEIIGNIVDAIVELIPELIQAGIDLLVALVDALPEIIEAIVAAIPQIIDSIVSAIVGSIPQIVQAGIKLLVALIQALPQIITTIVQALPQIITAIINALINNIPLIVQAGVELLVALIQNLPIIIVEIVKAMPQIITGIVEALGKGVGQLAEVGINLVKGLWEGIKSLASWLWEKVSGWISSIWDGIMDFFGIHSPSRKFAWAGEMMVEGLAGSIEDKGDDAVEAALDLSEDIIGVMDGLGVNASKSFDDVASGMAGVISAPELSFADIMAGTVNGMQTAVAGMGGGGATFNLMLPDGNVLATYYLPSFISTAAANGTPILNPA